MRVLVVEDDPGVTRLLRRGLERAGYAVDAVDSGTEALWMAGEVEYGAIVLDVNIPGPDGFAVCEQLRVQDVWVPVLLLTGRAAVADRVRGLDAGADDYLAKPFAFEELLARIRALTRRGDVERPTVLEVGDLRLDPATRTVSRAGRPVELTAKEFALLESMMRRPGQVLSRTDLLEEAWDFAFEPESNVVDVYVGYLRRKIDRPFDRRSIETIRGVGYRLRVDA